MEDIKIIRLGTPIPIVGSDDGQVYDPDATASRVLRLDDGPAYDLKSGSSPDMLLLIRDEDMKHRDQSRKRAKGNDGAAVKINYTQDDYRLVLWLGTGDKAYYAHFRDFIDVQISDFDSVLGVERQKVRTHGKRKVPKAPKNDEDED